MEVLMSQKKWPHPGDSKYIGGTGNIGSYEALQVFSYQANRFYADEFETWFDRDETAHNVVSCFKDGYTKDIAWHESLRPPQMHKSNIEFQFKDGAYVGVVQL